MATNIISLYKQEKLKCGKWRGCVCVLFVSLFLVAFHLLYVLQAFFTCYRSSTNRKTQKLVERPTSDLELESLAM